MKKLFDIFGTKWKLKEVANPTYKGEEVEGDCHYLAQTITVNTHYTDANGKVPSGEVVLKKKNEALYHEFLHACLYESGIRDQDWWDGDKEHQIISALQKPLAKNFPAYKKRS